MKGAGPANVGGVGRDRSSSMLPGSRVPTSGQGYLRTSPIGHERVRQRRAVDGRWDALTVSLVDVAARDWFHFCPARLSVLTRSFWTPSSDAAVTGFRGPGPVGKPFSWPGSRCSGLLGGRSVTRRFSALLLLWTTEIGAVGKRQ